MDNEMIERCAKVLWDEDQIERTKFDFSNSILFGMKGPVPWDYVISNKVVPHFAQEYRAKALAVIKAMREPTDKMMVEMERAEPQLECFLEKEKSPSYLVWIAAIDAVIK